MAIQKTSPGPARLKFENFRFRLIFYATMLNIAEVINKHGLNEKNKKNRTEN